MLANAAGIMPDSLKFEADRQFFERELEGVDVVVHGRHSHEQQPRSYLRRRLAALSKNVAPNMQGARRRPARRSERAAVPTLHKAYRLA